MLDNERATGLYRDWFLTGGVYLGIIALGVVSLVRDPNSGRPGWYGFFMALPVFVVAFLLLIPIVRNQVRGQLQQMSLAIVGFIYIGWKFGHLQFLTASDNPYGYLPYLVFARLKITGRENLPRDGSFVMVSNHSSHLDALCLLSVRRPWPPGCTTMHRPSGAWCWPCRRSA